MVKVVCVYDVYREKEGFYRKMHWNKQKGICAKGATERT